MTLHALYLRAARAKRAHDLVTLRMERIGEVLSRRVDFAVDLRVWSKAARRVMKIGRERRWKAETARLEARDRMLFDPYEEKVKRDIANRFAEISAARRKGMS